VPSTFTNAAVDEFHFVEPQRPHPTVAVVEELLGVDAVQALAALLVSRGDLVGHRELRPRIVRSALFGRLGEDLELRHRGRSLTVRRAQAVSAGVAATDDHHVLAVDVDR
jgi:hypothetical protein